MEDYIKKKTLEYKDHLFKSLKTSLQEAEAKCAKKIWDWLFSD